MPPMRLTLAELLDRYSIEVRKHYYGHGNADLLQDVYHEIWGQVSNLCCGEDAVTNAVVGTILAGIKLGMVNDSIASCEWQIREGRNLSLEDLGQRAVITRKLNDSRSKIKQELSVQLEQNAETRHFGFGGALDPEKMLMEVQEPANVEPPYTGPGTLGIGPL